MFTPPPLGSSPYIAADSLAYVLVACVVHNPVVALYFLMTKFSPPPVAPVFNQTAPLGLGVVSALVQ